MGLAMEMSVAVVATLGVVPVLGALILVSAPLDAPGRWACAGSEAGWCEPRHARAFDDSRVGFLGPQLLLLAALDLRQDFRVGL